MTSLPIDKPEIRLGMIGMTEGNGHPYSWSIIINGGFDPAALARCPYPVIIDYIGKQPPETLGIPGVKVTHVCCNDPADARDVAAVALIPNVVERPEEMIGQVDAVVIATDQGHEHVERARPFVEAGIPLFIDKPLCDNRADLRTFSKWVAEGKAIISSSSMRYAKEFVPYHRSTYELGKLRYISVTMAKYWETYGIHALEAIFPITGPGYVSVQNTGEGSHNVIHMVHRDGIDVSLAVTYDLAGGSGLITLAGTRGGVQLKSMDSYRSFKAQLVAFADYLRTGVPPVPFAETRELMQLVIAGIESRQQGGRKIMLADMEADT